MTLSHFYAIQLIKLINIASYILFLTNFQTSQFCSNFHIIPVKFSESNEEKELKILIPVLLYEIVKKIHMNYKN